MSEHPTAAGAQPDSTGSANRAPAGGGTRRTRPLRAERIIAGAGKRASGRRRSEREQLEMASAELRASLPQYPMRYLYILVAVGAIDGADRTVLATVFEDVKAAFGVSDSQLGLLTAAYSVVATLSVVPFGWIADRWHRVRLIALGFIPWSIAMIWTGAATSFAMMFTARLFLGTIEATNGPSTPSLLGDYYPVRRRSRVMGIFSVGNIIGGVGGLAIGGVLASLLGWRATFFAFGGLGLLCGAIVVKLLPEPQRGIPDAIERVEQAIATVDGDEAGQLAPTPPPSQDGRVSSGFDYRALSVGQATREILRVRTIWIVFVASAIGDFFSSGVSTWSVTYFRRYYDLGPAAAGGLAALIAVSLIAAVVISSRIGDRLLASGKPHLRIAIAAGANVAGFFFVLLAFSLDNIALGCPAFLLVGAAMGTSQPLLMAVSLDTVVSHLRGRANSVRSLMRVAGTALAPILFGFLSDSFSLRAAFLMTAPFMLVAGLITALATRTYVRDMDFAQAESVRQYAIESAEVDGGRTAIRR